MTFAEIAPAETAPCLPVGGTTGAADSTGAAGTDDMGSPLLLISGIDIAAGGGVVTAGDGAALCGGAARVTGADVIGGGVCRGDDGAGMDGSARDMGSAETGVSPAFAVFAGFPSRIP